MPFGIIGRAGPGIRQVLVHGKGYFWGRIWTAPLYPMGTLRCTCETVPPPSELRFRVVLAVVLAVGRGTAVLDGGQRSPTGRGRFAGFCSTFSQWEMPLDRRR